MMELLSAARQKPAAEREAYLRTACDGNEDLRREAVEALAWEERMGEFLREPVGIRADTNPFPDSAVASPIPIVAGLMVGQYRVESKLGEGGMSTVYLAIDTRLNRRVAIKFLSDDLADADGRRRFQREAQMASSLNHPHIITVHDIGEFEGRQYIIMEYVDGGTLKDWAKAQKRTPKQMVELLTGVADGLAAAHHAGILHRDIKPTNILVAKNGYAKLADFGLAKLGGNTENDIAQTLPDGPTRPGAILGTIAYMSPEQASGELLDSRSDVFSFGVVLYELLAGKRPFQGRSDLEVLKTIIHEEPKPLSGDFPMTLRNVVEKALDKNPAERYQSMREMVVDLRRCQRPSPPPQPIPIPRRSWKRITVFAVVVLLAALLAGWRLWERDFFWQNPLDGAKVERITDFDGDERDAALSPDGRVAAFRSNRSGKPDVWLTQIGSGEFTNITNGSVPLTFDVMPTRGVGFSGDGSRVWATQTVSELPTAVRTWIGAAFGGDFRPFIEDGTELTWSPDGSRIAYHTPEPGDPIFIADRNGNNPIRLFIEKPGIHCYYLTWSPDGRYIYFTKGTPSTEEMDIWRIQVSSTNQAPVPERITHHNSRVAHLSWLDSRTLIYSATGEDGSGHSLYALDVEHRIPHRVSSGIEDMYESVSVSQTRPRSLVASVARPSANLWTVPISDHMQTDASAVQVSLPNARAMGPRFGPGYLLFLSARGGADGLWRLDRGSARELWKGSDGGLVAPPAIAPVTGQICFSYRKEGRVGLNIMSADGTNVRALAPSLDIRGGPSWSPDGKWIAVTGDRGNGTHIFKIPVDGGEPVQLVEKPSYNPLWSPDGKMIVYSDAQGGGAQFLLKAVKPDETPIPIPEVSVISARREASYRFLPGGNVMIALQSDFSKRSNFFRIDLSTGEERQLTDWQSDFRVQNFDVSPDGKQIIFDRLRDNTDVILMGLTK